MTNPPQRRPLRIAAMLDLTWNFKRHTDVFAGVARYAEEHEDCQCIIDDFADHTLTQHDGQGSPYDGIIARVTPKLAAAARRHKLPLVNVWVNSPVTDVASVLPDADKAGELLAEHMLARGIRRFLCLMRRGDLSEKQLGRRFQQMVAQQGCQCDVYHVSQRFARSHAQWQKTRGKIEEWIHRAPMPAGVVTGVDLLARHVAQLCGSLGLRMPQEVAIAGGHNESTVCLRPEPMLTSIEYGFDHVGYEAARMIHRMSVGRQVDRQTVFIPPRELVVRSSSDFVYVDEEVVSRAIRFISQNAQSAIGIDDVAAAAYASRRTLETRFKRYLGRTVSAEIRRVRIDLARRLLAGSKTSMAQIAQAVGFGTAQYMARVFRREVGVSPSEYRNRFAEG